MLAPLLLALSFGAGVSGGADPVTPPRVEMDVVVTDARGRRVDSLTMADFSVVERGQRLPIESVRFVGPPPAAGPATSAASVAAARLFAILLDEYHITAGPAAERTREALARFVRDDLGPNDSIVVLRPLDSLLTIALTTDRKAALEAIAAFAPRRGDYAPRSAFEREFIAGAPPNIELARARIATSALNALTAHLGQSPSARKTLVVVSEGFVSQGIRRGEEFAPGLDTVTASANGANVTIYTVNPAGEATPTDSTTPDARARDALRALALGTGGMNEDASTDPRAALLVARADASAHYVVTFAPLRPGDGRLHPVDVAVSRRDLTVRARRSYLPPIVAAVPPPSPPSFLSEFSARFPRRTSTLIRPWFGMSRGETGKTMVNFVWEPAPRVPGERRPAVSPARIALSVTTLDGQPVYSGVVASTTESMSGAAASARASFEAPVGRLLVQMAIEDISAKVIDRDVRDLVVGGFRGPVSLGTASVLRARTVREQQELAANPDATPVAARQFSRSERLLVRVPVFSDEPMPVVSAKLVSGFGSVMRELPVALAPSRSNLYQFDVSLASLAAGAYALEISAQTSEGRAQDSVSIRVTP